MKKSGANKTDGTPVKPHAAIQVYTTIKLRGREFEYAVIVTSRTESAATHCMFVAVAKISVIVGETHSANRDKIEISGGIRYCLATVPNCIATRPKAAMARYVVTKGAIVFPAKVAK